MSDKPFGEVLRFWREKAGLSQRELAKRAKVSFPYLNRVERGQTGPPAEETIRRLADVLRETGVESDTLLLAARKVPSDAREVVLHTDRVPAFLRAAAGLRDEDWDDLTRWAEDLKSQRAGGRGS